MFQKKVLISSDGSGLSFLKNNKTILIMTT